ncbi:uncharacterized protein LOC135713281 [Ochlerotatus camptorhynchus]|uniref:uncharacterized protein LOC135713281 n=1 Tax=Ochlerotatus camptorhynchus TaxID=644619 RepID=UPI0031E37A92
MSTPTNWLTCRTCCKKERAKHIPVDAIDQNGLPIAEMIYQITDIMVTLDSHLPQQICPACLDELRMAHNFRQRCINSNTTLSRQIPKLSVVNPLRSDAQLALMVKEEHFDTELEAEEESLYNLITPEVQKPVEIPQQVGEYLNKTTTPMKGRTVKRNQRTLQSIANEHIRLVNKRYACAINDDIECGYAQKKYDPNNFVRHFRSKHRQSALKLGLLIDSGEEENPEKKLRIISKQVIEMDAKHLIETSIKLVTFHNLPLKCFEWEGFQGIYKPLMEPMGLVIKSEGIVRCIRSTVELMIARIRKEISLKLLSILVDSAVRHGQHVLTVSSQFELHHVVETRVLGIIWVKAGQTAKQLKWKVEEILNLYEISNGQIFAIIVENGTNMLTTAKKLHKSFRDTARDNVGEDTDGSEMDKVDELLEALSAELREQFNVIRGPIRNLHLALNDVLPDTDQNIFRFNRFARDLRDTKYDDFFHSKKESYPPVCTGNRWTSKYKLIRSIFKQKHLFTELAQKNPEIVLHDHEWQYVQEFIDAFQPLYDITKRIQKKHHPFSEFYMQWLMAIKELRNKTNNRFSKPLTESLTKRVTVLRENMAFKACMYVDPRFNYCESVVFTLEQRDEMKRNQTPESESIQSDERIAMNATKVQSLCRTCRKEQKSDASQIPIEAQDLNGKCIADMIYELTDIMVTFDRHLPQHICPQCLEELQAAYGFRQKCIDSNTILSKLVPSLTASPNDANSLLLVKAESCDLDQTDTDDDSLYDLVEQNVNMSKEKSSNQPKKIVRAPRTPIAKQTDQSAAQSYSRNKKRQFRQIVRECMETDGKAYYCAIEKSTGCRYSQDCVKIDLGNFIRHCRSQHPEAAMRNGLVILEEGSVLEPKKMRLTKQQKYDQDQWHLMEACVKLVAMHNLPVRCFEWDGLRILLQPLAQSLEFQINSANVLDWTHMTVEHLMDRIRSEMSNRLVSVKVDSARHHGQHCLTVSAQFEHYHTIVMRVLGVIRVTKGLTDKQLSAMVLELLNRYNLSNEQIFALVVGNEASVLAVGGKLQKAFADTVSDIGEWDVDTSEEADNVETLLDVLSTELRGQFNAIRGAVCNLQQIISNVVSDFDTNIDRIQRFVRDVNDPKYTEFFETKKASPPPLCCPNQWDVQYDIARSIIQQEKFYVALCRKYPKLALNESDWKFLRDYNDAFLPLHEMIELVQGEHPPPFSEFYMRWLLAIKDVRGKTDNQFSAPLVESLTKRLVLLKENMVYKAAIYLDPRFNYLRSVVFTAEQKEEIQNYIVSIWNRIQNLKPGMGTDLANVEEMKQEDKKDDMDDFLTEMFGGPSEGSSKSLPITLTSSVTPILHQLKSLEIEPRQSHTYDVWKHWLLRADSHPELFAVAMVVLSLPSNNVNLERAFSALVLSDRRDGLSEKKLEELLLVRLNRNLFEKVVLSMGDWKQVLGS